MFLVIKSLKKDAVPVLAVPVPKVISVSVN